MLSTPQSPSNSILKQSRQRALIFLLQLGCLFVLFFTIASFMLILLSNYGLNYIDTNLHPIIPKNLQQQNILHSWNDRTNAHNGHKNNQKSHGVLYCPLKYETLSEEVAETWHSARNYYECPVPMGAASSDNDDEIGNGNALWNFGSKSGISRVVCCEQNRCCTTHQWMDFTLFYSIMSRYAPWPVILLILMLFTTIVTVTIVGCVWQVTSLLRRICSPDSTVDSTHGTHATIDGHHSLSPTLSEMGQFTTPLFLSHCEPQSGESSTFSGSNTVNINGSNVPSSNGSSSGQSTATTGCGMADLQSRTNSSLSMSTMATAPTSHLGRPGGHVTLMSSQPQCPTGQFELSQFSPMTRNSLLFKSHSPVPNSAISTSSFLPSPTEVPKVSLATTFQWQTGSNCVYESVNAHNMNTFNANNL